MGTRFGVLIGGLLITASPFLPWITAEGSGTPGITITSANGPYAGWAALGAGIVIVAVTLLGRRLRSSMALSVILGACLFASFSAFTRTDEINDMNDDLPLGERVEAEIGVGVWLVMVGAAAAAVSVIAQAATSKR